MVLETVTEAPTLEGSSSSIDGEATLTTAGGVEIVVAGMTAVGVEVLVGASAGKKVFGAGVLAGVAS